MERLARERFGENAVFPVRFGNLPKRALLFKCELPFKKFKVELVGPLGPERAEKVEVLADGEQIVCDGIHPNTKRPYSWHGGRPGDFKREDLALIDEPQARALLADVVALLTRDFGYSRKAPKPKPEKKGNGQNHDTSPGDWAINFSDHDLLAAGAMRLLRSGMNDGAVVNYLRANVGAQTDADPDRLARRVREIPGMVASARAKLDAEATPYAPPPAPTTLDEVIAAFKRWLALDDPTPLYAALGAIAANFLPGDPVWLGLIAPPSSAKTEIINALVRIPHVVATATISMPALLSGTPKREKAAAAKGGLLRQVGDFGILIWKDFGSILSSRPDNKAELLAALREIFDGAWSRHLGTDGGISLAWRGKLGLVFGATQAYDDHHGVIASLGDRFLLCRLPLSRGQLKKALAHTGAATRAMREEVAAAVAGLFARLSQETPPPLSDEEIQKFEEVTALAVRLRAHVERDRHSRVIDAIHDPEGQGRIGLALERLLAGLSVIGLDRKEGMRLIEAVAMDSCPPLRRRAFELLSTEKQTTRQIGLALGLPTITARRTLEDLAAGGLALREGQLNDEGEEKKGVADQWRRAPEWEKTSIQPSPQYRAWVAAQPAAEGKSGAEGTGEPSPQYRGRDGAREVASGELKLPLRPERDFVEKVRSPVNSAGEQAFPSPDISDIAAAARPEGGRHSAELKRPLLSQERVAAAEGAGVEFHLEEPTGFTWIYAAGVNPTDPNLKLAEAAIDADRAGVEEFLRWREEDGRHE